MFTLTSITSKTPYSRSFKLFAQVISTGATFKGHKMDCKWANVLVEEGAGWNGNDPFFVVLENEGARKVLVCKPQQDRKANSVMEKVIVDVGENLTVTVDSCYHHISGVFDTYNEAVRFVTAE